jgi:putative heme-binding domain-containing protein
MQNTPRPLSKLWDKPPEVMADAVNNARAFFQQAARSAAEESRSLPERVAAVHLLAHAPASIAIPALRELLVPQAPSEIQMAVVRALAVRGDPEVSAILLAGWQSYGPELRRAVLEAVFSRPERVAALLDAVEQKNVLGSQLGADRIDQLRRLSDARLRKRAAALLTGQVATDRQKAVESYRGALDLTGDAARGKAVFKKNCAACHRLDNEGYDVGANLMAALRTKTKEALLIDILDPSREVDPRYVNYNVTTLGGSTVTGILAVETPSSITLRRAERQEDTILRAQIENIRATSKSLMPDEFEKQINQQELADLIQYLLHAVK